MDHVANCLELGVDPKQEPRDRAEGRNCISETSRMTPDVGTLRAQIVAKEVQQALMRSTTSTD
jgi:hypothetical protein